MRADYDKPGCIPAIVLAVFVVISGCAVNRNALVEPPGHYEDNRVFTTIDGIRLECRKDINNPKNPYHLVDRKPTFCKVPGQWPDQRKK